MADGEDYAKRTQRVKALLSSYYGGEPGTAAPEPGLPAAGQARNARPGAGLVPGVAAIDTPTFNADTHIANVLRSSTLEKLMTEHRNMAREIKNLDSDMQQLVYENYNKFISATDTIRVMKTSLDSVMPDMDRLRGITDQVTEKSLSVSAKLEARRETMESLHKVQQLLKKLQAVFDLPKKMRAALEEDALDAAVSLYAEAQPLLHKYGGKGTFRMIAVESDFVAQEISQVLKKRLTERKDDAEQCVLLLRKLGEPDDTLQDKYLAGRAQRIRRVLSEASVVADAMSLAAAGQPVTLPHRSVVESPETWGFTATSMPALRTFIKALDEKFINAMQETAMNVVRFFLLDANGTPGGGATPLPSEPDTPTAMAAEERAAAAAKRKPLVALAQESCQEYFAIVRRVVMDAARVAVQKAAGLGAGAPAPSLDTLVSFKDDWGAEAIAQVVSAVSTDVGLLASALPELGLKEKVMEVVKAAVRNHVGLCFHALRQHAVTSVTLTRSAIVDSAAPQAAGAAYTGSAAGGGDGLAASHQALRKGYTRVTELLKAGLASVLVGLKGYEQQGRLLATWRDEWADMVQGGLQSLFLGLLASFMELAQCKYDGSDLLREALKGSSGSALGALTSSGPPAATTSSSPAQGGAAAQQDTPKAGLVLMLAKTCSFLEQTLVPWVMETIASSGFVGGGGTRDAPPAFVPGEVARRLNAASSALVAAYVELHGRQTSLMIRRAVNMTNWLVHKEPRGPRPVCELLVERLAKLEGEVGQLLEDAMRPLNASDLLAVGAGVAGGAGGRSAAAYADQNAALGAGNVARNVAKLFREKVQIFGNVTLSTPAIMSAVCGVGLKSLVECIRLQTLGRAGLQQLQLDVAYLRPALRRYTRGGRGATVVESLLDEVVAAGAERCVEPQLLEPAVLDRILASSSGY